MEETIFWLFEKETLGEFCIRHEITMDGKRRKRGIGQRLKKEQTLPLFPHIQQRCNLSSEYYHILPFQKGKMQKSLDCHLEKKKTSKAACPWNKRCRRKDEEEEARWISICIKRFDEKKVFFTDLCDVAIFSDELDKGGGGGEGESLSCSSYNNMTSSIYQHLDLEGRRRRGGGKRLISLEAQTDVLLFFSFI